MEIINSLGLDRYDRKARLGPVLLTVMPPLLLVPVWLPEARSFLGGASVAILAGVMLTLLMSWVRRAGRRLQHQMTRELGSLPTTMMLRHDGPRLNQHTRDRVHQYLRSKGLRVPTRADQARDPAGSDQAFDSCVDWLREQTRDDKLLLEENIEFGFRRNLLAIKAPALAILLLCGVADLLALVLRPHPSTEHLSICVLVAAGYGVLALAWINVVRMEWVVDASWGYASRILAMADRTP